MLNIEDCITSCSQVPRDSLRPFISRLISVLLECFKDDSWPVRDGERTNGSGTEIRSGGGGAGVRGSEAADYSCEVSACEGQKLGGLKPP